MDLASALSLTLQHIDYDGGEVPLPRELADCILKKRTIA
jgi:hypothetical protein